MSTGCQRQEIHFLNIHERNACTKERCIQILSTSRNHHIRPILPKKRIMLNKRPIYYLGCFWMRAVCRYLGCKWHKDPISWFVGDSAFFPCRREIVSICWLFLHRTRRGFSSAKRPLLWSFEETRFSPPQPDSFYVTIEGQLQLESWKTDYRESQLTRRNTHQRNFRYFLNLMAFRHN